MFPGYRPRGLNDAFLTAEVTVDVHHDLETLRDNVSERIEDHQRYEKERYDKKNAKPVTYSVGQHVFVRVNKTSNDGKSRKLEPRYKGPFIVTKILDKDRYVVDELPGSRRSRVFYTGIHPSEKLKPFVTTVSSSEMSKSEDE